MKIPRRRHARLRRDRGGMAVVIVLALIAMCLSLAYAAMRVQAASEQVHHNSRRRGDARQAALTGMAIGLRRMHQSDWTGVGTTVSGALGADDSFTVAYTVGDAELSSVNPRYSEYPYRVTLLATGSSADPATGAVATHQIRAVVKLVPRALSAEPADWAYTQTYLYTQRSADSLNLHMPVQFRGPMRVQGKLNLNDDYHDWKDAGDTYLTDINVLAGQGSDFRPFTSAIHWRASRQSSDETRWITTRLGLAATDTADRTVPAWLPTAPTTKYRIYPGGKEYDIPTVPQEVPAGTTLAADPLTNPLGIFYRNDRIRLWNNVTVRGTLISQTTHEISVQGTNVTLEPFDLPPLVGTTTPIRLPTIIADSLKQYDGGQAAVKGYVSLDDEMEVRWGSQDAVFTFEGKLVSKRLNVRERTQWNAFEWDDAHALFGLLPLIKPLFPVWVEVVYNAKRAPKIIFRGDAATATYHWPTKDVPIYAIHPDDAGLRWDLVSWKDNP